MRVKFNTSNTQLAALAGVSKRKASIFTRTAEVKETRALLQAHELLWSKYNTTKGNPVPGKLK